MINILSKETRELIAAGEVVERPASVVKELVENSIDAGASAVTVELVGNGLAQISVTDNGVGIPFDEIKKAFLRHATSKISVADDIDGVMTLGFRGEALAAISSVARVKLTTKTAEDELGGEYRIDGGTELSLERVGCPDGTRITVTELFYNTPARMKFLKSDVSEGNAVQNVVEQLALAHPEVSFKLLREGKQTVFTAGDNRLSSAVFAIFPRGVASAMLEFDGTKNGYAVNGLITDPSAKRQSRSLEYVFVNGRYVKDKTITAAAEAAFASVAGRGGFPAFALNVEVAPEMVDVNVHPAKTEVRFSDERGLFSAVYAAIKNAVDRPKQIVTEHPDVPQTPPCENAQSEFSLVSFIGEFDSTPPDESINIVRAPAVEYAVVAEQHAEPVLVESNDTPNIQDAPHSTLKFVGELFRTYIVCEYGDDVVFIDKHAAHERILFERFSRYDAGAERQTLLTPIVVELSLADKQALVDNGEALSRVGFLIEDFGEKAVLVREVPTFYKLTNIKPAVELFASQLAGSKSRVDDTRTKWLLQSLACRAAIKANDTSEPQELMAIATRILSGEISQFCPHGRPVYHIMQKKELERWFER